MYIEKSNQTYGLKMSSGLGDQNQKNSLESQTAEASLVFLSLLVHVHPRVGGMRTTACTSVLTVATRE